MSSKTPPVIVATGFSVFPGAPENPTQWAIGELERERWHPDGARLVTRVLPVRYDVWPTVADMLAREKADAAIGFGLSAKALGFTLETTARNQLGVGRADASGAVTAAAELMAQGAATYPSSLPLREIEAELQRSGTPVARSDDAGDYICNLFFYRLATHAAEKGTPRLAGFVHVPYLDEQVPRLARAGVPTADLKTLTRAQLIGGVRAILSLVAKEIARREYSA